MAGVAKTGKAAQSGYNKVIDSQVETHYLEQLKLENPTLSTEELKELYKDLKDNGKLADYDKVRQSYMDNITGAKVGGIVASSVGQGLIEAGTWYVTYGKAGGNLKESSKLGKLLRDETKWITPTTKVGKLFLNKVTTGTITKAGVQAAKEYGNEFATILYDGKMDWETANTNALVSASTSLVYDTTVSEWMGAILKKLPEAASETAKVTAEELDEVADIVDNEIAPTSGSNVAASKPLMKEIGNFIKKMPRIVIDYGKNNADGKKIIGGGIKSIIKEFEKPIVTEIVNEIGV